MMRRVALVVIPLLVVCALLEVTLRATHMFNARLSWTEPDRQIGWKFTPGRNYWFFLENDHPITGRINRAGWRDRERPANKPSGTQRIAVVGDSFVEAFQVELDSTFAAIAERALNARGTQPYEVLNFGRSGMSQAEEMIVLERDVLPHDPDLVLLLFTPGNDIRDINPSTAPDRGRPFFHRAAGDSLALNLDFVERRDFRIRELINPFKQNSALLSLVVERYNAVRLTGAQRGATASAENGLSSENRMCTAHADSVFVGNYELCKFLIARMAQTCKARNIRFVLASVPLVYEDDVVDRVRAVDPTFDPTCQERDLAAFAHREGFEFLPLTNELTARSRALRQRLNWSHWNYAGHRLVAEKVAGMVVAGGAPSNRDSTLSD